MVVTSWTFKGPTFARNCWSCPWCGTSDVHNFGNFNCSNTRVCNLLTFEYAVAPSGMSITSQLSRKSNHYPVPISTTRGWCSAWHKQAIAYEFCCENAWRRPPLGFWQNVAVSVCLVLGSQQTLWGLYDDGYFFRPRFQSVMACPFGVANPIESSLFLRIFQLQHLLILTRSTNRSMRAYFCANEKTLEQLRNKGMLLDGSGWRTSNRGNPINVEAPRHPTTIVMDGPEEKERLSD